MRNTARAAAPSDLLKSRRLRGHDWPDREFGLRGMLQARRGMEPDFGAGVHRIPIRPASSPRWIPQTATVRAWSSVAVTRCVEFEWDYGVLLSQGGTPHCRQRESIPSV